MENQLLLLLGAGGGGEGASWGLGGATWVLGVAVTTQPPPKSAPSLELGKRKG